MDLDLIRCVDLLLGASDEMGPENDADNMALRPVRTVRTRLRAGSARRVMPALLLVALMLSALGLLLSNGIRQLENFAGVMNFVIFPMFFLSSALYPLWKMREANEWLFWICSVNPFTYAVELVRYALYERLDPLSLGVCLGLTLLFSLLSVLSFNPQHAALRRAA